MNFPGFLENKDANAYLQAVLESRVLQHQRQQQQPPVYSPAFNPMATLQNQLNTFAAMGIPIDPQQLHAAAMAANAAAVNAAANAAVMNAAMNGLSMFLPNHLSYPYPQQGIQQSTISPLLHSIMNNQGMNNDHKPTEYSKKRRTNYRRPENAAKLNAAVNALIMQKQDGNGHGDIRAVSKLFNIPYNTLRDNYLRVTTGDIRCSKRRKKHNDNQDGQEDTGHDDEELSDDNSLDDKDGSSCEPGEGVDHNEHEHVETSTSNSKDDHLDEESDIHGSECDTIENKSNKRKLNL